jgi:hypothetical protein
MVSRFVTNTIPLYIRASILASCVAMLFGYYTFLDHPRSVSSL